MQRRIRTTLTGAALAATALFVLSGCSGSGSSGDSTSASAPLTYQAADGTCAAAPLSGVDYTSANQLVTSFEQPATGILATEPLKEPIKPGMTFVYLNNGTPVAAIFQTGLQAAANAAGVNFVNVDTGTDAQSINSALNSVVEMKPDVVLDQSVDATFFQDQLKQLQAAGTIIVYGGQVDAAQFGLKDSLGGAGSVVVNSDVLAAGAIDLTCGTATNFVFYSVPELPSAGIQQDELKKKLAELCPQCTLRVVDISIADPSPADKIVSDLQAHPETQFFISMADQYQIGLQDKANLAGITNAYGLGQSSLPTNFQQIADGQQVAGYAVDFNIFMWLQIDEGLRRYQGMDVPYLDDWLTTGQTISHFITKNNAGPFTQSGYVAYPGMEAAFEKLWGK